MKLSFMDFRLPLPQDSNVVLDFTLQPNPTLPFLRYLYPGKSMINYEYNNETFGNYMDYLLRDDCAFMDMMKVVYSIYENKNVVVLIDTTDKDILRCVESFQKILQYRYDLVSNIIFEEEDKVTLVDTEFSVKGLYNLDLDKARFVELVKGITKIRTNPHTEPMQFYTRC